jgi:uracil-DNA glycosylase family protein
MSSHSRTASEYRGAEAFLPRERDLASLRRAAASCRGCDLWQGSTQVVFGEGPVDAEIVLVGEQPGDHEDREGHPFVGPAGRVLDDGLAAAGIDRGRVYLTNAVKHFKWEASGRRRLHKKPTRWEVIACGPWLTTELMALTPDVLVLMGAVAAQSLLGPGFSVLKQRGRVRDDPVTVATVHPASILRAPDELRAEQMDAFVADLRLAAELAGT